MRNKILICILIISSVLFAANGWSLHGQRFAMYDQGSQTILKLSYQYLASGKHADGNYMASVFPRGFGVGLLNQKIVFNDSERKFYNLDFYDGCFVVLKDGTIVGVSDEYIAAHSSKGLAELIFQDDSDVPYFGKIFIPSNKEVLIKLAKKIDPWQIQALVLTYGVGEAGFQVLDFYSLFRFASNYNSNGADEISCMIAYIPVTGVVQENNKNLLLLEKAKIEYLGDGMIIAPFIPLANFNSLKTKRSLVERLR